MTFLQQVDDSIQEYGGNVHARITLQVIDNAGNHKQPAEQDGRRHRQMSLGFGINSRDGLVRFVHLGDDAARKNGKTKKVALVACMRKLLTVANSILRNNTEWNPNHGKLA